MLKKLEGVAPSFQGISLKITNYFLLNNSPYEKIYIWEIYESIFNGEEYGKIFKTDILQIELLYREIEEYVFEQTIYCAPEILLEKRQILLENIFHNSFKLSNTLGSH